jgi:hypothetical protein
MALVVDLAIARLGRDTRAPDGNRAYEAFVAETGITQMALVASQAERTVGCYHIQNVNAYQSRSKSWLARFKEASPRSLSRPAPHARA